HGLIEAQVQQTPNRVALVCGERKLSYKELNGQANRLARYLIKRGVGPNVLAAICLDRDTSLLVALLAVMKAGGAYVPLDPNHPIQRRLDILSESGARILITHEQLMPELMAAEEVTTLPLEMVFPMLAWEDDGDLPGRATPDDLAYVLYTSGSTGRP